jgi:Flagellar basal body P-ring biosynthesis protein
MNRKVSVLIGIIALLLAIGGTYYIRANYLASLTVVEVPVPRDSIAVGTQLTADMVEMKEFPSALVNLYGNAYATSPNQLVGLVTRGELPKGLPIPSSVLVTSEEYRPGTAGEVLVSIPVNPTMSVGDIIRSGDYVDIYRLYSLKSASDLTTSSGTSFDQARSELVATVLVVYTLDSNGDSTGRTAVTAASSGSGSLIQTSDSATTKPTAILVVSAPRDIAEQLMRMQVAANEQMWITLSVNKKK